jgi:uncharacterized protein
VYLLYVLIGLCTGILVGFMGVGGGVILIPAMMYLLHMDQHMAQGTSLLMQLPPVGLGALLMYWRRGQVDLWVGAISAVGLLLGGYFGSKLAIRLSSEDLHALFGVFLMITAVLLWRKSTSDTLPGKQAR